MALSLFLFSYDRAYARKIVENPPQDVTYCQFAKDPTSLSAKRVRIRAIYSYMFEVSSLKSPLCCPAPNVSMWVDFDQNLDSKSRKFLSKFPKGMGFVLATFTGMIESGQSYGTGQSIRLVVDRIELVERAAKPHLGQSPSWVPKDCDLNRKAQFSTHNQ